MSMTIEDRQRVERWVRHGNGVSNRWAQTLLNEIDGLTNALAALRAEVDAIEQALPPTGRNGVVLLDRVTELVVQRKFDNERCRVWENEVAELRAAAGEGSGRIPSGSKAPLTALVELAHEANATHANGFKHAATDWVCPTCGAEASPAGHVATCPWKVVDEVIALDLPDTEGR